jgi:exopolysaccharide biosynthesis polyprenyl glycosylphosphotransferase
VSQKTPVTPFEKAASAPPISSSPAAALLRPGIRTTPVRQVLADALALTLATAVVMALDIHVGFWGLLFVALAMLTMISRRAYSENLELSVFEIVLRHALLAIMVATAATVTIRSVVVTDPRTDQIGAVAFAGFLLLTASQVAGTLLERRARRRGIGVARTLIIGSGHVGRRVAQRLTAQPHLGLAPIGYLDDGLAPITLEPGREDVDLPVIGGFDELSTVAQLERVDAIIVAFSVAPDSKVAELVEQAHSMGIAVFVVPRLFDAITTRSERRRVGTLPFDVLQATDPHSSAFKIKYAVDRVVGSIALVILSPLLLVIAICVKVSSPGPVFFRQRRIGMDGAAIDILKFRSMRMAEQSEDNFSLAAGTAPGGVEGEDRRTPIGKFIRRTNLDELPQFINIVKGQMSLVGPRPERPEFVERFSRELHMYDDRHRVKAGLTGWAQINGLRGQTSVLERAEWDNYYIENWSPWFDIVIVCRTVKTFFERNE